MKSIQIKQNITDHSDKSLMRYLKDISKIPLLTAEEEFKVAVAAKNGDKKAHDKLITANLRFVVSCAKQYQNQGLPLIDLINEGNLGLSMAAEKFIPEKGFKFISYAVWWIRQSILLSLSKQSRTIRLPVNQIHTLNHINRAYKEYNDKYERSPTPGELEKEIDLPYSKIIAIINANSKIVSVSSPLKDDEESTLCDIIEDKNANRADENIIDKNTYNTVQRLLDKLTLREHDILKLTFGIDCDPIPVENIAKLFGITTERVRQIKNNALNSIRSYYSNTINNIYCE